MAVRIGTSGWSYPTWRPGFYPAGTATLEFLRFYATCFDTVELNSTAYRLPGADQFVRWAEAVPDGFRFAPKLVLATPGRNDAFLDRVRGLGDRLGPVRVVVPSNADPATFASELARIGQEVEIAVDLRLGAGEAVEHAVAVNDVAAEPYRYIRLREPPYDDDALARLAATLRAPAYVYFRHEDDPTAPAYAARLRELVNAAPPRPAPPG
jgi:uncharacterized protein YecE (DUF72 family)